MIHQLFASEGLLFTSINVKPMKSTLRRLRKQQDTRQCSSISFSGWQKKQPFFFSLWDLQRLKHLRSLALTHDLSTVSLPMISDQNMPDSEKCSFQPVFENEIKRIVMSFQFNKAPRYDKVPMAVLKDALPCILLALTDIVNHSLLFSVLPASKENVRGRSAPKGWRPRVSKQQPPCFFASSYVKAM